MVEEIELFKAKYHFRIKVDKRIIPHCPKCNSSMIAVFSDKPVRWEWVGHKSVDFGEECYLCEICNKWFQAFFREINRADLKVLYDKHKEGSEVNAGSFEQVFFGTP